MFVANDPWFCMETKIFLVFFGHIWVVIGMILFLLKRQNVENELKKINLKVVVEKTRGGYFFSLYRQFI